MPRGATPRRQLSNDELTELYLVNRDPMWRTAQRILKGVAVAGTSVEDVVQQVVVEIKERGLPEGLATPAQIKAYLRTCVVSRSIDALRKRRQHEHLDDDDLSHRADPGPMDPSVRVEQAVLVEACLKRLCHLTPNERFAFEERVVKQRPAKDVASELKVAPPRVSQLVTAALRKLRAGLEEDRHAS
jgi:RNA polymerase sigma factor (sigma-70 family)